VSPRFELETVISKLCWLDRWVPTVELRAAVERAQEALGVKDGIARPLAGAEPQPPGEGSPEPQAPAPGDSPSITEGFKNYIAAREGGSKTSQAEPDEDVPFWSRISGTSADPEPDIPPQAKRVLDIFGGTIIAGNGADHEH
jgi:DNA polymerase-3 subunit gamma/tau